MRKRNALVIGVAAALGLGLASPAATAAPSVSGEPAYTLFDVGGAIPEAVDTNVTGLTATAAVPGLVVGTYRDSAHQRHGFVARTGKNFSIRSIRTIDVTGSADVMITSVNRAGAVSGYYLGAVDQVEHGFIQDAAGRFTWLDHPDAVPALGDLQWPQPPFYNSQFYGGTFPGQVTNDGTVVGFYSVARSGGGTLMHGFTWTRSGGWTSLDFGQELEAPNFGTQLFGMNARGTLVGSASYPTSPDMGTFMGITVARSTATTYNYPGLPLSFCSWTAVLAIDNAGTMVGNAGNGCSINQWAWMLKSGNWTTLQYQDSEGRQATETIVAGLGRTGLITGTWNTWTGAPTGDWLSPNDPRGYGTWHGFIATTPESGHNRRR